MDVRTVRARCGIVGPAIAGVTIGSSILLASSFAFTRNALSDLGAPGAATAPIFNAGLILAGIVSLPFCWHLVTFRRHPLERVGGVLLALSVVSLAGVGLFPTGTAAHLPAAVAFYLLATYGIAATGTGAVLAGSSSTGLVEIWAAVAILSAWPLWGVAAAFGFPDGLALPETVGALVIATWFVWTATRASPSH